MARRITSEQFHEYQQQWTQLVADGDVEGQNQRANAAYWVAYCFRHETGGIVHVEEDSSEEEDANNEESQRILEQVIQEQEQDGGDNLHDKTGKHCYLLAYMLENHDQARSSELYRQAIPRLELEAQQGGNDENYQEAAFWLGHGLFIGKGVDREPSHGIHWWKAAAELGHTAAQFSIEYFCFQEPFISEIAGWLHQIADHNNNVWALWKLGFCYEYGHGVKKDFVKAVEWYNKAIVQGHDQAAFYKRGLLSRLSPEDHSRTLGGAERNQKIKKAKHLVQQSFVGGVPLSLWSHALASFQHQDYPPWEAPSPTFLSLCDAIMPQLQKQLKKQESKGGEESSQGCQTLADGKRSG